MSVNRVDYDTALFKSKVSDVASDVLAELIDAGRKFDGIVDQLGNIWTTNKGKARVSKLRTAKTNEFDSLISTVSNQDEIFASVSKDLSRIDNI